MTSRKGDTWDSSRGGVRLLSRPCATCIYRPGNLMHLQPGRLKAITAANLAADSYLVCHATLRDGEHPQAGEAVCRGWYDRFTNSTTFMQIGNRLRWWREVAPPGEDTP